MALRRPVVKLVVGVAVLALLGFLFASTLRDVAAEPYAVEAGNLRRWTVAVNHRPTPDGALLLLRPPTALPMGLFDQVFQRTMESFATPADPGIPLVLQHEFDRSLADAISSEELASLAREVGLENAALEPLCMAVHRTTGGREQRLFFVLFALPEFTQFRSAVAELARTRGGGDVPFDPDAAIPALFVASSDVGYLRYIPPRAELEGNCESPVIVE
jgi:hypothetical protein